MPLRLPPLGPANRHRPVSESEGQPAPADIEPGPLEVAEQRRGERDDVIRESMAMQAAAGGRHEGYLTGAGERELTAIGDSCLKLYRLLSGQYNYEHPLSGNVTATVEEQEVGRIRARAGTLFTIRRFAVLAPEGAKLRLYKNNINPSNLVEVFTAAQEGSTETVGTLRLRERESLVATVLGCKAAGTVVVHFEGDLVSQENVAW